MLSGGEQQRVALARALAPRPRIMLMDEPFSGLDNRLRDGIRDETLQLLKDEGTAVVLVTHEPEEAMRMADQIALMRDGRDRAAGRALQHLQRAGATRRRRRSSAISTPLPGRCTGR
jgi:ABC-type nitrate/sulfonate/bicarbonate transport system ATPase subunit